MPITNPTVLEDTPVDGELSKAPTSNWAADHNARDATAAVQGHATAAQIAKLDGIEAAADVTASHAPQAHAASHVAGDAIQSATAAQAGLATAAQITKLDGIEAAADVTDATNVAAAGAIMKSLLTEQGDVIYASGVATPAALAHGTAGDILQSGGHAANPSWLTHISCRVYDDAVQSIPNATDTVIAFAHERWDTDTIHDTVTNNGRLTCKTAGTYLIVGNLQMAANATGDRYLMIRANGTTRIAVMQSSIAASGYGRQVVATIYVLAVNEYVELQMHQSSGGALNTAIEAQNTPEFMMARIA